MIIVEFSSELVYVSCTMILNCLLLFYISNIFRVLSQSRLKHFTVLVYPLFVRLVVSMSVSSFASFSFLFVRP